MATLSQNVAASFVGTRREIIVWTCIYLLLVLGGIHIDLKVSLAVSALALAGMIFIEYFNTLVLIPRLLTASRMKQAVYYLASVVMLWLVIHLSVWADYWVFTHWLQLEKPLTRETLIFPVFKYSVLYIFTYAISNVSHTLARNKETRRHMEALLSEKKEIELRFLKAQINPHFLFNALNNIYSMAYMRDVRAADSILKLSEMLRYVTEDCQAETLAVEKEVLYIENYIDFQQLRFESQRDIVFTKEIANAAVRIPPMILQPFVENCFKHSGIESNPQGYIRISLFADEKELRFVTENSLPGKAFAAESTQGNGIGFSNARQRLELTFPGTHRLRVTTGASFYRTELYIRLSEENGKR